MFFLSELFLNLGRQIGVNDFYLGLGPVATLIWSIFTVLFSFGLFVFLLIPILKIRNKVLKWILVGITCVVYALLLFVYCDLTVYSFNVLNSIKYGGI